MIFCFCKIGKILSHAPRNGSESKLFVYLYVEFGGILPFERHQVYKFRFKINEKRGVILKNCAYMVDKSNKSDSGSGNFATKYCMFALPLEDNKFY